MPNPKGFIQYKRELPTSRPVEERVKDYKEVYDFFPKEKVVTQANRCMDCGVPFCQNGCPLGNIIPEFNEAVQREDWKQAFVILNGTNNFPEFTGRICPAPCEQACVLGINQPPVTIENIEKNIAEIAFEKGYIRPQSPLFRTGKKIAIIGAGPTGLAAAAQLNKAGHSVTVYERDNRIGGLLRYGIPDFKLEKWVIDRRVKLLETEGIRFQTNTNIGVDLSIEALHNENDAVLLAIGSTVPRNLPIEGRHLNGIHFAMDYLVQNNKLQAGDTINDDEIITTKDKHVVVIGSGDTGSDCIGTANRSGAKSITQLALMATPPPQRHESTPWPLWSLEFRTSSSHEEGCERQWAVSTKGFVGDEKNNLKALRIVDLEWKKNNETGKNEMIEVKDSIREIPCEVAFIAIGFAHPQKQGLIEQLGVAVNERGNIITNDFQTNVEGVFAAGDAKRGQSLVVWAIAEGREAAYTIDKYLMGSSNLEQRDISPTQLVNFY